MKNKNESCLITKFTAQIPDVLTKKFFLDHEGNLQKVPGGQLVRGRCEIVQVVDPKNLAVLLANAKKNEAFAYGVPKNGEGGEIFTKKNLPANGIARSREHFEFRLGPGVMVIDQDPEEGSKPLSLQELWRILCERFPGLSAAPIVGCESASTHIYNAETGECFIGAKGLRIYLFVQDAQDIPRAGKALVDGLWIHGLGYFRISKSGIPLERTLVDAAVWQPEHLDFIAGAACSPPLQQRRSKPKIANNDGTFLDTKAVFKNVTDVTRLKKEKEKAFEKVRDEQKIVRDLWIKERLKKVEDSSDEALTDARRATLTATYSHAINHNQLLGDFELITEDGKHVTVAEVLESPDTWHNCRFADPLEPGYRNDNRIARANLKCGGRPFIFSYAHGGQKYDLINARKSIKIVAGDLPNIVSKTEEELGKIGSIYQRGGELVRAVDNQVNVVSAPWLRNELEKRFQFLRLSKNDVWLPGGCPKDLEVRIIHNRGSWKANELQGIIRAPLMRQDGSILITPGYDETTKLLLIADPNMDWPTIPNTPSSSEIRKAVSNILEPFEHYPFRTAVDRSVLLCSLLTAVQRPVLEAAPAFHYSAHTAASGKGKLAKSVSWLGGTEAVESPWPREADEQRKTLLAKLREAPQSLLLDNVVGALESDVLCAILTARFYEDRILGVSQRICVPTNTLLLITGNNVRIVGDLNRRILTCVIDHGVERPDKLQFPFDPVELVRANWVQYRTSALTILRGFVNAGSPKSGPGTLGSFEMWDRQIRQCVIWLMKASFSDFELADPADSITANFHEDPETAKIRALMLNWFERFSSKPITVQELIRTAEAERFDPDDKTCLYFILDEIAGEGSKINSRRLGRWIERNAGRIVDGMKIVDTGRRPAGYRQWKVICENEQL